MTDNELIDLCSEWLQQHKAAFLAKENKIVYYHSITGLLGDYKWYKLSPNELIRTLKLMYLPSDKHKLLKPHHLISAFQENERMYKFGVNSQTKVDKDIFNFAHEGQKEDPIEKIVYRIADELFRTMNMNCLVQPDVIELTEKVLLFNQLPIPERKELVNYVDKQMIKVGYKKLSIGENHLIYHIPKTRKKVKQLHASDMLLINDAIGRELNKHLL